jgi:hypothetical protein
MSEATTAGIDKELDRERKELKRSLDETLAASIREAWLRNTAVWLGVTLGAFALNLLVLVLVTGG